MRTGITLCIVVAVVTMPYWVYLPILIFAIVALPFYVEAVLFGFIIDILYGVHTYGLWAFPFAIAMTILVMIAMPARTYIRFHA